MSRTWAALALVVLALTSCGDSVSPAPLEPFVAPPDGVQKQEAPGFSVRTEPRFRIASAPRLEVGDPRDDALPPWTASNAAPWGIGGGSAYHTLSLKLVVSPEGRIFIAQSISARDVYGAPQSYKSVRVHEWMPGMSPRLLGKAASLSNSGKAHLALGGDGLPVLASDQAPATFQRWDGASWVNLAPPLPDTVVEDFVVEPSGSLVVATRVGASRSLQVARFSTAAWEFLDTSLSAADGGGAPGLFLDEGEVSIATFSDEGLRAGTWNGSAWDVESHARTRIYPLIPKATLGREPGGQRWIAAREHPWEATLYEEANVSWSPVASPFPLEPQWIGRDSEGRAAVAWTDAIGTLIYVRDDGVWRRIGCGRHQAGEKRMLWDVAILEHERVAVLVGTYGAHVESPTAVVETCGFDEGQ